MIDGKSEAVNTMLPFYMVTTYTKNNEKPMDLVRLIASIQFQRPNVNRLARAAVSTFICSIRMSNDSTVCVTKRFDNK